MTTIAALPNGTRLARLPTGEFALVFSEHPNHTTAASGNPAYYSGSGFNGFVSVHTPTMDYAVRAMVVLTDPRAKLQAKAIKAAAKAADLKAQLAALSPAAPATEPKLAIRRPA